jgi:hypothetical protein
MQRRAVAAVAGGYQGARRGRGPPGERRHGHGGPPSRSARRAPLAAAHRRATSDHLPSPYRQTTFQVDELGVSAVTGPPERLADGTKTGRESACLPWSRVPARARDGPGDGTDA